MNEINLLPEWTAVRSLGPSLYLVERGTTEGTERATVRLVSVPEHPGETAELADCGYDADQIRALYRQRVEDIKNACSLMNSLGEDGHIVRCDEIRYGESGEGWELALRMEELTPLTKALGGQVGESRALRVGIDLCDALARLRDRGVVHRAISPQSVFVTPEGDYKLGEFRFACPLGETEGPPAPEGAGSYFEAPELWRGEAGSCASDLYSLGLLMYWLVNKKRLPYLPAPPTIPRTSEIQQAVQRRCKSQALPPPAFGSAQFQRILQKACAPRPENRYSSPEELRDALLDLQERSTAASRLWQERQREGAEPGAEEGTMAAAGFGEEDGDLAGLRPRRKRPKRDRAMRREPGIKRLYIISIVSVLVTLAVAGGSVAVLYPLWNAFLGAAPAEPAPVRTEGPVNPEDAPPLPAESLAPADAPVPTPAPTPEPAPLPTAEPSPSPALNYAVDAGEGNDTNYGAYRYVKITGLTPYVFAPTGAGRELDADVLDATAMMERYGAENGIVAGFNAGIFYDTPSDQVYCFRGRDPDGVVIAGGVVLKSVESVDHTGCDILVIDEDGQAGWAPFNADADALAAGTGEYYDVYGQSVTGKRIISAVTGFVPIVVGGENRYAAGAEPLHGYDNYVSHYTERAARQLFCVTEDGSFLMLQNETPWTLDEAAQAAIGLGCVFAYNLDGGSSVEAATASGFGLGTYEVETQSKALAEARMPTYLVFTASDRPPQSARPVGLRVETAERARFRPWTNPEKISAELIVTEILQNANGKTSERRVYSALGQNGAMMNFATLVTGGANQMYVSSPGGSQAYIKTREEIQRTLALNGSSRREGVYYDFSTGYTLETSGSLREPGEVTVRVSYDPGGGYEPLTTELTINLSWE